MRVCVCVCVCVYSLVSKFYLLRIKTAGICILNTYILNKMYFKEYVFPENIVKLFTNIGFLYALRLYRNKISLFSASQSSFSPPYGSRGYSSHQARLWHPISKMVFDDPCLMIFTLLFSSHSHCTKDGPCKKWNTSEENEYHFRNTL